MGTKKEKVMYEYCDKRGSRGCMPHLYFRQSGKLIRFDGQTVSGVAVVVGSDYEQAGKWSGSTYRLQLAADVTPIRFRDGWETGTWREGIREACGGDTDTWAGVAASLGVGIAEAQRFFREEHPKEAAHFNEVEEALIAVDDSDSAKESEAIVSTVSFGAPRNRDYTAFWAADIVVRDEQQNIVARIKNGDHEYRESDNPAVKVLDVVHSAGHHGGYYDVKLAMPSGWTAKLEY